MNVVENALNVGSCYMCSAEAVSKEHVPPRSLFPEAKEVGGANYRKELITVPACHLHNGAKSMDDEFLLVSLAGIIGNNSIGYVHRFTKVDRTIKRHAGRILDSVIKNKKSVQIIRLNGNKFLQVIWGTPDLIRLNSCFEHIARALYFHHFQKKFNGEIKSHLAYLQHTDLAQIGMSKFILDKLNSELDGKQQHGANKDIFFYQVSDPDQFGLFTMKLCFYGGINVLCAFLPKQSIIPENPIQGLIDAGIPVFSEFKTKVYRIG